MNLAGLAFVPQGMQDFQTRATKLAQAQLDLDNEKRALQAQSGAAAGWLTPDGQAGGPSRAAQSAQGVAGGSAGPAPAAAQPGQPGVSQYAGQPGTQPGQPMMINGVPVNPGALPGSAGSSMTGPDAPPGQSAGAPSLRPLDQPMAQQGQGGPGVGGTAPGAMTGPPGASPGAQQPPGGAGGAPQFNSPDPQQTLRAIATRIKQANPKMDNATLFQAVTQTVGLMGKFVPEQRLQLQAELQIANINQRADAAIQRAQSAQQVAEIRAESARQIADLRDEALRRGQDFTHQDRQRGQDLQHGDRLAAINARIDAAAKKNPASAAAYKTLAAERQGIKDEMAAILNSPSFDQKKLDAVNAKLQAANKKIVDYWSRNQELPRPSELDGMGGGAPAAAPGGPAQPAAPGDDQAGKTIPIAGADEGPTATNDKGQKVKWDGKAWVAVQ